MRAAAHSAARSQSGLTASERNLRDPADFLDSPRIQIIFYSIIFTIPLFRFRDIGDLVFMKVDWLLMALLLMLVLPAMLVSKIAPGRIEGRIWMPLFMFLIVNAVSSALSPFPDTALAGMVLLGQVLIFLTVNMLLLNDRGVESTLPWVLGASIGLNSFLAVLGYVFEIGIFTQPAAEGGVRGVGGTISSNNVALMCVYSIPLMVYMLIYAKTPARRLLALALTLLLVAGVVVSESRGGFLNFLGVSGLVAWQFRHHFDPRYLGLLIGGTAALLLAFVLIVPQDFFERQASVRVLLDSLTGESNELVTDAALDRRAAYLEVAGDVLWERPFLGHGTDTFKRLWIDSEQTRWFAMEERPAHNTYAEVLVGTGLIGLAAFLMLLWVTYSNYRRAERTLAAIGDESGRLLMASYRIAFISILVYFLVKSGIDHKIFILAMPLSDAVRRYAVRRAAGGRAKLTSETEAG